MIDIQADCERRAGVTFVRATVTNTRGTPQSVRLRSTVDGPVWTARSGPVVASGWDADVWEGVVAPGQTCGLGYATPADPTDDPIEVVSVERAEGPRNGDAEDVLVRLESAAPPSNTVSSDR